MVKRTLRHIRRNDALRMIRLERRLTQQEVARRLNVSQGTYSLIETGYRDATDQEARVLAKILRADRTQLGFDPPSAESTT